MPSGSQIARVVLIAVILLVVGVSTFAALLKQPGAPQAMAARIVITPPPVEIVSSIPTAPAVAEPVAPANPAVSPAPASVVSKAPAALEQPVPATTAKEPAVSVAAAPSFPPMQTLADEGAQPVVQPPRAAETAPEAAAAEKPPGKPKPHKRAAQKRKPPVRPQPYDIRDFFAGRW